MITCDLECEAASWIQHLVGVKLPEGLNRPLKVWYAVAFLYYKFPVTPDPGLVAGPRNAFLKGQDGIKAALSSFPRALVLKYHIHTCGTCQRLWKVYLNEVVHVPQVYLFKCMLLIWSFQDICNATTHSGVSAVGLIIYNTEKHTIQLK